ncbi:hypothetical protein ACQJBY_003005 [Aegilops geniculata]
MHVPVVYSFGHTMHQSRCPHSKTALYIPKTCRADPSHTLHHHSCLRAKQDTATTRLTHRAEQSSRRRRGEEGGNGEQPAVLPGVHAPLRRAGRRPRGAPQRPRRRVHLPAHRLRRARRAPQPRAHRRGLRRRRQEDRHRVARLRAPARPHLLPHPHGLLRAGGRAEAAQAAAAAGPVQDEEAPRPRPPQGRHGGGRRGGHGGAGQLPAGAPVGEAGVGPPAAAQQQRPRRRVAAAAREHSRGALRLASRLIFHFFCLSSSAFVFDLPL